MIPQSNDSHGYSTPKLPATKDRPDPTSQAATPTATQHHPLPTAASVPACPATWPCSPRRRFTVAGLCQCLHTPYLRTLPVLLLAAILTTGCRTVLNLLRTIDTLAPGHPSSYHRVFSRRRCSMWRLGRALAHHVLSRWVPTGRVLVAG